MRNVVLIVLLSFTFAATVFAQTAQVTGFIKDSQEAAIPKAKVTIQNLDTDAERTATTNESGLYTVPFLQPGQYRISVSADGFQTAVREKVKLEVAQNARIDFVLKVGDVAQSITVEGGAPLVNTQDAAVGTVIDRNFVEHMPLNGRSFNTLLQLTPGVVIVPVAAQAPGQFSVNGQRTNANNFQVDGVSANFGISAQSVPGQAGTGGAQAFNVFGGTSSLVSVDALQEFRVETSSYAPEYGRSPGGQVLIVTRSGTNNWHGSVFNYFRNDAMDANDWFANHANLPRAALRQNDFGASLGGPILRNRLFFFSTYEGLRLRLPQSPVTKVPTLSARSAASPNIATILNAYPIPNGANLSSDLAQFTGNYSDAGMMDAGSVRIDYALAKRHLVFGRFNYSPSDQTAHDVNANSVLVSSRNKTQTFTFGGDSQLATRISNSIRLNLSYQDAASENQLASLGGAVLFDPMLLLPSPLSPQTSSTSVQVTNGITPLRIGTPASNSVSQFNIVETISVVKGSHQLKFGGDYRHLRLDVAGQKANLTYTNFRPIATLSTTPFQILTARQQATSHLVFPAFSLYGQDTWHIGTRLVLAYGLRWERNPAPEGRGRTALRTFDNIDSPSALALAPPGTPLWDTTNGNFAPRVGVAARLTNDGTFVFRAGAGLFYDLGTGAANTVAANFPNAVQLVVLPSPAIPISNLSAVLPPFSLNPPLGNVFVFSQNLQLPRSWQWNTAIEKSFGVQSVSLTYVGQVGRRLLSQESRVPGAVLLGVNNAISVTRNGATSDYNALQAQFKRRLSRGLQVLANYTWSHSLDTNSDDSAPGLPLDVVPAPIDRGQSSFDLRHQFSLSATYSIPGARQSRIASGLTKGWQINTLIQVRSGLPVNVLAPTSTFLAPGLFTIRRPDRVAGVPFYVPDSTVAGGRTLNPAAFTLPGAGRQGNLGRNSVPGFGAWQADLSLERSFPIAERFTLHFGADAFNVFNHPNFANPDASFGVAGFGLSSRSLNRALGGLSQLYQIGGPRSLQLSLRLAF